MVFPLAPIDAPVDADLTLDPCTPAYDDPGVRYALVTSPNAGVPWRWQDARDSCLRRGMDLVVYNDDHEAGQVDGADGWPYWIGELVDGNGWQSIDGCPPFFGKSPPTAPAPQCGVTTSALEISAADCDTAVVTAALCETPRRRVVTCQGDPALSSYTLSKDPLNFDAARAFCTSIGAHLVVIDSDAELLELSGRALPRVWIGSTFDGTTWATETQCPAVYSWTGREPDFSTGGKCAATALAGEVLQGMAVANCIDGGIFALCESVPESTPRR